MTLGYIDIHIILSSHFESINVYQEVPRWRCGLRFKPVPEAVRPNSPARFAHRSLPVSGPERIGVTLSAVSPKIRGSLNRPVLTGPIVPPGLDLL